VQDKRVDTESVLIAIGPEGGFSVEEARAAQARGFKMISLGRRILRAETAALTAVSLAQFLWGDLQ
jgi:16S rRNA (uracil1498-N3)-methyltransferase